MEAHDQRSPNAQITGLTDKYPCPTCGKCPTCGAYGLPFPGQYFPYGYFYPHYNIPSYQIAWTVPVGTTTISASAP